MIGSRDADRAAAKGAEIGASGAANEDAVRGADIVGTPLESFSKILATSDKAEVFNGYCGAESGSVPVSANATAAWLPVSCAASGVRPAPNLPSTSMDPRL